MDNETNSEGASGKDSGKMKPGDKVWVLCEVVEGPYRGHISCKNGPLYFRPLVSEVKPVEPEAVVKDSLTTEPNSPRIPDSSSEPLLLGDAVRFVWPGHKWHRTEGTIISTVGDPSIFVDIKEYPYRFKSDCGAFERWCSADQLKRIDKADPVNPSHYKQLPAETIDIIEAAIAKAPNNKAAGLHWQVLKYALRCWFKNGIEDLKKARWYLDRLIQEEESK
jgi:hypothetical protein